VRKECQSRHGAFFEHFLNTQIEMLKTFRSLVKVWIAGIEKRRARAKKGRRQPASKWSRRARIFLTKPLEQQ
jgi:hypothetical protein